MAQLGAEALSLVERHAEAVEWRADHNGWCIGRVEGDAAYEMAEGRPDKGQRRNFTQCTNLHHKDKEALRHLLEQDGSKHMLDWRAKLGHEPLDDVPLSLQRKPCSEGWSGLVIPDPLVAEQTGWECLPAPLQLKERAAPQGWLSAVGPV